MRVRALPSMVWVLAAGALAAMCGGGCTRQCASRCEPRGPWQSPTIRATRSLLLVNTTELKILRIDGRNVQPTCIGAGGAHEYYIAPGAREITASFRYATRVGPGLIGAAHGRPLTQRHTFLPGHVYVAIYREHLCPEAEAETLAQALAAAVSQPYDSTWSLRIVDLADPEADAEPEVLQARIYTALITASAPAVERPMTLRY